MSGALTLDAARIIADTALSVGRSRGMAPLAVAVLDARGALKAYLAEDATSLLRFDIAYGKAWGTLGMGFGGRELARRATRAPAFMTALQTMSDGRMVPAAGGVLIRNGTGAIIGAVGISGDSSDNDELCAVAGIEKAGLAADTGDPR